MAMGRPFAANPLTEVVVVRVTSEFKEDWREYCKSEKVEGSKLIRTFMEKEMKNKK